MSNVHPFPTPEQQPRAAIADAPVPAYVELAVTTNFSFLRGGSHPEELVERAIELGVAGLGIADRNTVAGVVRSHTAAYEEDTEGNKKLRLKIAPGARLVFADGTPDILAYPQDRSAWGRLTRLLTVGKSRGDKAECILYRDDLLEHIEGLNLIVLPPERIDANGLMILLSQLKTAAFLESVWLAASVLYHGDDRRRLMRLISIADDASVPLIAVNDVLYHAPERRSLQDVVTCIREHVTIETGGRRLEANAERHLKSPQEMARLFRRVSGAIEQTTAFLGSCNFSLDELRTTEYPKETRQGYATPQDALIALVKEGEQRRYPNGMKPHVREALNKELTITAELKYAPYFLTVHDIVRFARSKGILCQGRGSAANSVICYCLGITEVDPHDVDLLFERFVSTERREPPDIDVDFEHERREEVIQYIYERYGRDHAGMTATVICYRGRSAIREVGKVFGLSDDTIGALASTLWGWSMAGVKEQQARAAGLDPDDPRLNQAMNLAQELMGFPRHLSQHVGGFAITRSRLDEVVAVENAAMEDRTVIEWDKDDLNDLGILKVDVLGLGMLSCLRRSFDLLRSEYRLRYDLSSFKDAEPPVYRMISRADTIGVFQVESRAQMSMLPRLRPKEFYDLVIEVAIVRPGPIQGKMVHPYLQRREALRDKGIEPDYPSPSPEHGKKDELKDVLKKTLGIPLFQEQAMRLAIVAAKFKPEEADRLRRAMATFKRVGTIKRFEKKFIDGMSNRGYDRAFAIRCFEQIKGFGEYGFPESHAASFANLVYASSWIKCRYPDVFAAALLNSQPMGFYAPAQIVRDAQEHGVEIRPVDVNLSDWDCNLEDGPKANKRLHQRHASMRDDIRSNYALRLGFRQISGFSEDDGKIIESVRGRGFDSVRDLWLRTRLKPAALEKLAEADAFGSLGLSRRDALWAVRALRRAGDKDDLPLFKRATMAELEPDAGLPPMLPGQQVIEDYRHLHLSLKAHPVSFLRADLDARGIVRHDLLPTIASGKRVTVAGIVLVRQRPGTGNAIFMTLEDETAIANTILWPRIFERFRPIIMGARLISVTGPLQNEQGVIHIVAEGFEDLSPLLHRLSDDAPSMQTHASTAIVKADEPDRFRHPRSGDSFVRLAKAKPNIAQQTAVKQVAKVLPRGRNFH
ncbi:MAG: DNA polymerase III subunit alpha [Rhizobiales bacterium]|nr:DNA polymerase III subunit alpha [Hyphomicrobiales bacterium]